MASSEREHPRYAHEAAVTFHAGGAAYQGRTTNVSRGGLCADVLAAIPTGVDVDVDLQLVFEGDVLSDALRLPAQVVWCTKVDTSFQVGLVFRLLPADKAQHLSTFLRYLDDGVPTARQPRARTVDDQFG